MERDLRPKLHGSSCLYAFYPRWVLTETCCQAERDPSTKLLRCPTVFLEMSANVDCGSCQTQLCLAALCSIWTRPVSCRQAERAEPKAVRGMEVNVDGV